MGQRARRAPRPISVEDARARRLVIRVRDEAEAIARRHVRWSRIREPSKLGSLSLHECSSAGQRDRGIRKQTELQQIQVRQSKSTRESARPTVSRLALPLCLKLFASAPFSLSNWALPFDFCLPPRRVGHTFKGFLRPSLNGLGLPLVSEAPGRPEIFDRR